MELTEVGPTVAVQVGDVLTATADALVVPTAAEGFVGEPWTSFLNRLGVEPPGSPIPLGSVLVQAAPTEHPFRYLMFAASIFSGGRGADIAVIHQLGQELGRQAGRISDNAHLVSPLLGTGVGRLPPGPVLAEMANGFIATAPQQSRLDILVLEDIWAVMESSLDALQASLTTPDPLGSAAASPSSGPVEKSAPATAGSRPPTSPNAPSPAAISIAPAAESLLAWSVAVADERGAPTVEASDVILGSLAWARHWPNLAIMPDDAVADMVRSLEPDPAALQLLLVDAQQAAGVVAEAAEETLSLDGRRRSESVLAAAERVLRRTTGDGPIQQRHLLATGLTGWRLPDGVVSVLGADNGDLCMRLCAAAVEHYPSETQQAWDSVLGLDELTARFSSDFVPVLRQLRDGVEPVPLADQLNVNAYVTMLASTIVRKSTAMPMSIGLFGEWGSGKSYFMQLLRQRVTELSRSSLGTGPYLGDVVQITFNAWTYADTNLWASLASEFFDQLGAPDVDPVDARRDAIRSELVRQNQLRTELETIRAAAQDRTVRARQSYVDAVATRERATRTLNRKMVAAVIADPNVQAQLTSAAEQLGLITAGTGPASAATAEQVLQLAEDARGAAGDLRIASRAMQTRTLLIPFLGVAAALLVTAAAVLLVPEDWAARVFRSGAVASALALLGGLAEVARRARAVTTKLRGIAASAETVRDTIANENAGEIAELSAALHRAEADETLAQQRLADLDATIAGLDRQLADLAPGRRLYQFIAERAASSEYRGQLGVVSSVRRDFQQLVDLMHAWAPEAGVTGSEATKPIDRIVLYIDDLDRCEPEQVVQVLQAVHLLLAMDLFVVVVGVDPRWLLRALQQRYQGILATRPAAATTSTDGFDVTTPQSYLEKIFQIPFVLPQMTSGGFAQLIRSLGAVGPANNRRSAASATEPQTARETDTSAGPAPNSTQRHLEPLRPDPGSENVAASTAADPARQERVDQVVSTPVTEREMRVLGRLSGLVRTPRETTRLFNIYGMLRSTRDLSVGRQFLGGPSRPGDYQAVAQLLGILAAAPDLLGVMLWGRRGAVEGTVGLCARPAELTWWTFVEGLLPRPQPAAATTPTASSESGSDQSTLWQNGVDTAISAADTTRWASLARELLALRDVITLTDLEPYWTWGPQVARFSFLLSAFAHEPTPAPDAPHPAPAEP